MRANHWIAAVVTMVVASCGNPEAEQERATAAVDSSSHGIISAGALTPDIQYPGVCVMRVALPPDDEGSPQDPITCSCSLVANNMVLTAAACVFQNVEAGTLGDIDIRFNANSDFNGGTPVNVVAGGVEIHRYFREGQVGRHDIALVRVDGNGGQTPLVIRDLPLTPGLVNQTVALVGFGQTTEGVDPANPTRHKINSVVEDIDDGFIRAGTSTDTTCSGDTGGPVLLGNLPGELIGVTLGHGGGCRENVERVRLDRQRSTFLFPYIDQFEGNCPVGGGCSTTDCRTADPDCPGNECQWGNTCKEDCPTRDWDCPLGSFVGESCAKDGDCEEEGFCEPAVDQADVRFCVRPCDPEPDGIGGGCPQGMECAEVRGTFACRWLAPSPGAQGFTCNVNDDCTSGICEDDICVNPCDPLDLENACPEGFTCGESKVVPGTTVCLGPQNGGGGFCAAGGTSGAAGFAFALLGLLALRRRWR